MDALILFNILDIFEENIKKSLAGTRRTYTAAEILALIAANKYKTSRQLLTKGEDHE